MDFKIYPVQLGIGSCYLLQKEKCIMIDAGSPNTMAKFTEATARLGILPQDIQLILITHGHWDHVGIAKEVKGMTGAPILLHKDEKNWLEKGLKPIPPGISLWGKTMAILMKMSLPMIPVCPAPVDIVMEEEFDLSRYGIPGKIFHTPGHSPGSVSLLMESGEAFVGDLAMNMVPLCFSPRLPIFGDDLDQIKRSWRKLIAQGARIIYPAHGKAFDVEIIKRYL